MEIRIKACLVFDEVHDWDELLKDLKNRNINAEKKIVTIDGNEIPMAMIDGSMGDMFKLKLDYICLEHPENDYIWYPMTSYEEKLKAQAMLRNR